jgi:hypothetical protein
MISHGRLPSAHTISGGPDSCAIRVREAHKKSKISLLNQLASEIDNHILSKGQSQTSRSVCHDRGHSHFPSKLNRHVQCLDLLIRCIRLHLLRLAAVIQRPDMKAARQLG